MYKRQDNNRAISKIFTVADTNWNRYTIIFPADTTGAFGNDNGNSLVLQFFLSAGSNYTNNGTFNNSAWGSVSGKSRVSSSNVNFADSTSNNWYITGVQLEVGDTATTYEHRSYGEEFARCQRYYQQYTNIMSVGYVPDNTSKSYSHGFNFPVEMRAAPTLTVTNTGSSGGQYVNDGQTNRSISSLNAHASQTSQIEYYFNLSGDLSDYRGAYAVAATSTTYQSIYKITAEL